MNRFKHFEYIHLRNSLVSDLEIRTAEQSVAAAGINQVALIRSRADTATVAAERGIAALGFALVVREQEEVILIDYNGGTIQGHIGHPGTETLSGRRQSRSHVDTIVGADRGRRKR